jgi:dTDP-4-amino-4,6-dideoxygalactose transaminase
MARVFLSPPDVGASEREAIVRAFDGGWIAPLGPEVDAFETELAAATGRDHGVALSSGTAALHLALMLVGVEAGDRVAVQSLTFSATANAIRYVVRRPGVHRLGTGLMEHGPRPAGRVARRRRHQGGVTVDLYGQCADYDRIEAMCDHHGVPLIEDAAEALGATYGGRPAGTFGALAGLSFNGNKIITTSGGGALVTGSGEWAAKARFLATQARDPAPHYQHSELGYNYRLSNLLAALGRAQLSDLARRVDRRRDHNRFYREALADVPGIEFMPEAPGLPLHLLVDRAHRGSRRHRCGPGGDQGRAGTS